ncbi:MAG: hypothetical protein LUF87_10295 [Alistipes sp.]|nr:hypothetical protein [Alistipes sp.]
MKILIVSYFFEPEVTPRAFRASELAKAFVRRGHEVTVALPNKEAFGGYGLAQREEFEGIRFIFGQGGSISGRPPKTSGRIRRMMPGWMVRTILYFYNHEYFAKFDRGLYRALAATEGDYDLLISISYPAAVHRAVMKAFRANPRLKARVKVAEFSDPPLRGEYNRHYFPAYNLFLKRAGRFFDRFSVPVPNALPVYTPFKRADRISIIPQGFDNSGITLREYRSHARPTFAFSGRFYRNTRDPEPLLRHLAESGRDFELVLFLIDRDPYFDSIVERYAALSRGTITVRDPLPRKELIGELSAMDFLVNHNFTYTTATPSKLIDYSLAGRPVYSFRSDRFDAPSLERFLDGDYGGAERLPDPAAYDIEHVATLFEELAGHWE